MKFCINNNNFALIIFWDIKTRELLTCVVILKALGRIAELEDEVEVIVQKTRGKVETLRLQFQDQKSKWEAVRIFCLFPCISHFKHQNPWELIWGLILSVFSIFFFNVVICNLAVFLFIQSDCCMISQNDV